MTVRRNDLDALLKERSLCEVRIEREVRKLYAVGATVLYSTFNYACKCRVIEHGYGTRITLRNIATGKTRSVDGTSYDIVLLEKSGVGRLEIKSA